MIQIVLTPTLCCGLIAADEVGHKVHVKSTEYCSRFDDISQQKEKVGTGNTGIKEKCPERHCVV